MPAPGPDTVDVDALAGSGAELERRYPLADFSRLADLLAAVHGEAVAKFAFARLAQGLPGCDLSLATTVTLTCQRCLEAFELPLQTSARLAFVASEDDASQVPDGFDAIPADDGRIDLAALVEDELLLSLPVVALHPAGSECAAAARRAEREARAVPDAGKHRPFAQLQDLLKH